MSKQAIAGAMPRRRSRALAGIARIALGLMLLAALYAWRIIDLRALAGLAHRPDIVALALIASLANIPLEGLRWQVLLRAQGIELRLLRTSCILAASLFFANFLPGAAGGDVIRGVYLYNSAKGRRTAALLSILIDRLIGLVAIVLLGLVAVFLRPGGLSTLAWAIVFLSVSFIAALVLLFLYGHRVVLILRRLLSGRHAKLAQLAGDIGAALRLYAQDWRSTGLALALSFVIAGLAVGPIVLIAEAMQLPGPNALDYGIAGLYSLIANSLPVTPGGIGVGEGAFASACALLAPPAGRVAYGTIFLAFRCIFMLSTLPGLAASTLARRAGERSPA